MGNKSKKFFLGIFTDEETVLHATGELIKQGVPIHDVYSPHAIHGLDDVLGIKRSRLPIVCFIAGTVGLLAAILFQMWVFGVDWPIIVGGKPFKAIPAFIPVTFEMTVLVGGLVSVAAFLFRSKLFPQTEPLKILDAGITNDKYVIAIEKKNASINEEKLTALMNEYGAQNVKPEVIA